MLRRPNQSRAFTLVELMISIALVVMLMLGITKVFSLTSATAGATNQMSASQRDGRAAQGVFYQDFSTAVSDGAPCMLLYSSRVFAFRNPNDAKADRDNDPRTIDLNGNNVEGEAAAVSPGEIVSPTTYNNYNHRTDSFSFFSRQRLRRQTGGALTNTNAPLMANMTSDESWIWYGHLMLPNNATPTVYMGPGAGTLGNNQNNFYASQWILGRVATLLKQRTAGAIKDKSGNDQAFVEQHVVMTPTPTSVYRLEPLQAGTQTNAQKPSGTGTFEIQESRFDLAETSIDDFRNRLETWLPIANSPPPAPQIANWWTRLFCAADQRFQANPFVGQIDANTIAQQAPIFLQGCSQFMVEYAGDFLVQDTAPYQADGVTPNAFYGRVTNVYTNNGGSGDGQIDFVVTNDASGNRSRKIRWYGLPRDTWGQTAGQPDGRILVDTTTAYPAGVNKMPDVVPLRDVWRTSTTPGAAPYANSAPFERFGWKDVFGGSNVVGTLKDYGAGTGDYAAAGSGMRDTDYYTCAWGPSDPKPKMIRIIITLDDPSGKLADGQTFEYVFTLP